jgi:hypothetical protein
MTDRPRDDGASTTSGDSGPPITEVDRLISRFLDGEATEAELDRFATLAASDLAAWRALGDRLRDQSLLERAIAFDLARAQSVNLPTTMVADEVPIRRWMGRTTPYLGWAAALALSAFAAFGSFDRAERVRTIRRDAVQPHIVEERPGVALDPILLQVRSLEDGRWLVEWIDRRGHSVVLDEWDETWVRETLTSESANESPAPDRPPGS